MNKQYIYKILYYICFASVIFTWIGIISVPLSEIQIDINLLLGVINLILTIIFIIKSIKTKLENVNLLFPIIYLIFTIIVVILMLIMNNKLIIPYIHFNYYGTIILFNYLLLNIYSVLSCFKTKNN